MAVIVLIEISGKNHIDPYNYRSMSLTSSFGNLYGKLMNNRLTEYQENSKLLTAIQCGCKKNRSTIDHLVRFDTSVR